MEHIEEAGIHSGDSACSLPPYSLGRDVVDEIVESTRRLALELGVRRPDERAVRGEGQGRLRARGEPARLAHRALRVEGDRAAAREARRARDGRQDARGARLHARDLAAPLLGEGGGLPVPQVPGRGHRARPRDEEHGRGDGHRLRLRPRLREGADRGGQPDPGERAACSCRCATRTRAAWPAPIREFADAGFQLLATAGTAKALEAAGIAVETVAKVGEGSPDIVDRIEAGEVDLVVNTVEADPRAVKDSFAIRRAALQRGLPYFTTFAALRAAAGAVRALRAGHDRRARAAGGPPRGLAQAPRTAHEVRPLCRPPSTKPSKRSRGRSSSRRGTTSRVLDRLPELESERGGRRVARARTLCVPPDVKQRLARLEAAFAKPLAGPRRSAPPSSARSPRWRRCASRASRTPRSRGRSPRSPASGPRRAQQLAQRGPAHASRICSSTCPAATTTGARSTASRTSRSAAARPSAAR